MKQTVTGVIETIDRLHNTRAGNPQYEITLDNGESYITYPNANFAYALTGNEDGKTATLTIGRLARIESITIHH